MRLLLTAALLWTAVAAPATAAVTGSGDLAAEVVSPAFGLEVPPTFQLLNNSGQPKAMLPLLGAAPAFGANDHLFYLHGQILELDSSLTLVRTIAPPFVPADLAVGSNGDLYVLSQTGTLAILSPAGAVKQSFPLPFGPQSFDLAPDGCTILYLSGLRGHRFNACSGQPMADLAAGGWAAVRALSDGGYIAIGSGISPVPTPWLAMFDAHDQLVRSYQEPDLISSGIALAFDADSQMVWVGTLAGTVKLQLSTGAEVRRIGAISDLAVDGESRPTIAPALQAPSSVPALSPLLLFFLAGRSSRSRGGTCESPQRCDSETLPLMKVLLERIPM